MGVCPQSLILGLFVIKIVSLVNILNAKYENQIND